MATVLPDLSDAQLTDIPSQAEVKVYQMLPGWFAQRLCRVLSSRMDLRCEHAGKRWGNRFLGLPSGAWLPVH